MKSTTSLNLARAAARVADEKLGQNIIGYDVRKISPVTDVFLFISATSHIHVRALEDAIRESLKAEGGQLLRTDGQRGHLWRVLDYGELIVHIMEQKTREFYALERLWEQGKRIQFFEIPDLVEPQPVANPVPTTVPASKPKSKPKAKSKTKAKAKSTKKIKPKKKTIRKKKSK